MPVDDEAESGRGSDMYGPPCGKEAAEELGVVDPWRCAYGSCRSSTTGLCPVRSIDEASLLCSLKSRIVPGPYCAWCSIGLAPLYSVVRGLGGPAA